MRYAPQISFSEGFRARPSRPPSDSGDSGVGCILPFLEVIVADSAGPAATWDSCSNVQSRQSRTDHASEVAEAQALA
jgi:hypothetical protein